MNTTVAFPGAALLDADSVTLAELPGVNIRREGFAVTPEGSPLTATVTTEGEAPFAVAEIETEVLLPPLTEVLAGDAERVKPPL